MLGVKIEEAAHAFGDDLGAILNATDPASTLKKKHIGLCHHRCGEANAMGMVNHFHVGTDSNGSDFLTKALGRIKHQTCGDMFLHEMLLNEHNPRMWAKDPELKKGEKRIPKTSKCGLKKRFNHIRSAGKPKMNDKAFGRDDSKNGPRGPLKHRVNRKDCHERPLCNGNRCHCKHLDGSCEHQWNNSEAKFRNHRFKK